MINEELARRNKENHSFSDYKSGSATAEYEAVIAEATQKIEIAKSKVSPENRQRLDNLLESYKVKYSNWINSYNANGARHVSWMIAGPSNYNMRAHEKYLSRESKLWEEYDQINNMIVKGISRIVNGERIISSDNPNAVELLKEKIAKLEKNQETMKAANKLIKNSKIDHDAKIKQLIELGFTEEQSKKLFVPNFYGIGFASFELSNNNANIRRLKQRLIGLERRFNDSTVEKIINGVKIVDNVEDNRLQLFFGYKPPELIRNQLKSAGFHWTPSLGCWQRFRSNSAKRQAEEILDSISA